MIDTLLRCAAAFALAASTATAQVQAGASTGQGAMRELFMCVTPKTCSCWAFSELEKAACPECTGWQKKPIAGALVRAVQSLDTAGYRDAAGLFVTDASRNLYALDPKALTVAELYRDPGKFGFREAPTDSMVPGSFVVYPTIAGLVLNANKDVLYPSASLGGKLNVIRADALVKNVDAKILVPKRPDGH